LRRWREGEKERLHAISEGFCGAKTYFADSANSEASFLRAHLHFHHIYLRNLEVWRSSDMKASVSGMVRIWSRVGMWRKNGTVIGALYNL
jgi:hypothetical protein